MSLFQRREADLSAFSPPSNSSIDALLGGLGGDRSLRSSAVWAARRVRADLISSLPRDVYRKVAGRSVEVPRGLFFDRPSSLFSWPEWVYASQMDLDAYGNAFGEVAARDGAGRPAQVELSSATEWTVRRDQTTGVVTYRHRGQLVPTADVWHERQYVVPGFALGLSPIAYSALSLAHNLSAQEFAVQWFTSGASTAGVLRNKERTLDKGQAAVMKDRFRVATQRREVFVTGSDWEFSPADGASSDAKYLDAISATAVDFARYYSVPADLIDAAVSGQSVTYANLTQRMLQLLVVNLGPAIDRREQSISERILPKPRFFRFNSGALLRMDEAAKTELLGTSVDKRILTPDEARGLLDREPLTEDDYAQFDRLFGATKQIPGSKTTGVSA
ncbi:MAG: phage portal protein [Tessaracoccus sp.]|uniref:phage portal protein n=1 Tax=Tessaracoccus sp. TaxID=1971211 RepID=UPI001EB61A38|nr:phage portal protein [Tessaracoccus sp.]MBK7823611.1 phage portal protein [Tessaracoccus sp.]